MRRKRRRRWFTETHKHGGRLGGWISRRGCRWLSLEIKAACEFRLEVKTQLETRLKPKYTAPHWKDVPKRRNTGGVWLVRRKVTVVWRIARDQVV